MFGLKYGFISGIKPQNGAAPIATAPVLVVGSCWGVGVWSSEGFSKSRGEVGMENRQLYSPSLVPGELLQP